jgi:hypothetical protein
MNQPRQFVVWNGEPERLADGFRMTKQKGERTLTAVCEVYTHVFGGRELRLQIDGRGVTMESVVRSHAEVLDTVESWRAFKRCSRHAVAQSS